MKIVKGPDFPTGGIICGTGGIWRLHAPAAGASPSAPRRTSSSSRATGSAIVITEIPYQVNKTTIIEKIADFVQDQEDPRDQRPARRVRPPGMRIVVELKKEANPRSCSTSSTSTPRCRRPSGSSTSPWSTAPRTLNLPEMLQAYIATGRRSSCRRTQFELAKAETRAHILEGLLIALDDLDEVISIIRHARRRRHGAPRRSWAVRAHASSRRTPSSSCGCSTSPASSATRSRRSTSSSSRIEQLRVDPRRRDEVLGIIQAELAELKRQVRRRPAHRDRAGRGRDRLRGPHRRGGHGDHHLARPATSSGCR